MRPGVPLLIPGVGSSRGKLAQKAYARAGFRLDSRYNPSSGAPTDLSANALPVQNGSTGGADTNDVLFLPYDGERYVYLPGLSGNTISVPKPAVATARWTATLTDNSTVTGTTAADPVVFGTSAGFSGGKSVRSFVVEDDAAPGAALVDCDFRTDPVNATHTAFTASTGQTVTVNRATSGRKTAVVEAPKWLLGTDDYIEVQDSDLLDFGASDSFTVLAVVRQFATPATTGAYVFKGVSPIPRWGITSDGTTIRPRLQLNDGTDAANAFGSTVSAGQLVVFGGAVDRSAVTAAAITGGAFGTPQSLTSPFVVDGLANTSPMRIGALPAGANYQDFELYAVYIWREALSASELAAIAADWGAA